VRIIPPLLFLLFCITACNNSNESTGKYSCYENNDSSQFSNIEGHWYRVAVSDGVVNKPECFAIDTTGFGTNDSINEIVFAGNRTQRGGGKENELLSKYTVSPDNTRLYNYDFPGDSTGDSTIQFIAKLDAEYLVLIQPADTVPFRRNPYFEEKISAPVSYLYKRRN